MRRSLLTIAAFAAVGAVLSIASGWGCLFWRVFVSKGYLGGGEGRTESGGWPLPVPDHWPAVERLQVTRDWGYDRRIASASGWENPPSDPAILARVPVEPSFAADPYPTHLMKYRSYYMFCRRSGWPFKCLLTSWVRTDEVGALRAGYIPAPPVSPEPDQFGRDWTLGMYYERGVPWPRMVRHADGSLGHFNLPVQPVWWAFAANTLLWGLAAWVPIRGVWAWRRAMRARRGVCPYCTYPVGRSSVCTECGRPLHPPRNGGA